ncbi:MAG TPA: hypothetical protein VLB67_03185 [Acidimicrobiia bacterium]|nr:hypothetical protein [Acidimicrobiia bacterium]
MRTVERHDAKRRWKWLGAGLLGIPLVIVTIFAVEEGFGGEEGWLGHLIQLAVGVTFLAGCWLYPKIVGPLLFAAGVVFTGMWLQAGGGDDVGYPFAILLVATVLAGVFFTLAGYTRRKDASP